MSIMTEGSGKLNLGRVITAGWGSKSLSSFPLVMEGNGGWIPALARTF
jgi:hypothetical protein